MRALAVILLAWTILITLFSRFIGIPFLGFFLELTLFSLAKNLSFRELFKVYLIGQSVYFIYNLDSLIGLIPIMKPLYIELGEFWNLLIIPYLFVVLVPFEAVVMSLFCRFANKMRGLSREFFRFT